MRILVKLCLDEPGVMSTMEKSLFKRNVAAAHYLKWSAPYSDEILQGEHVRLKLNPTITKWRYLPLGGVGCNMCDAGATQYADEAWLKILMGGGTPYVAAAGLCLCFAEITSSASLNSVKGRRL